MGAIGRAYTTAALGKGLVGAHEAITEADKLDREKELYGMKKELYGMNKEKLELGLKDARRRDVQNQFEHEYKVFEHRMRPALVEFVNSQGMNYQPVLDAYNNNSQSGYSFDAQHTIKDGDIFYDLYVTDPDGNRSLYGKSMTFDDLGQMTMGAIDPQKYLNDRLQYQRSAAAKRAEQDFELDKLDREYAWKYELELMKQYGTDADKFRDMQNDIMKQMNKLRGTLDENDLVIFEAHEGSYTQFGSSLAFAMSGGHQDQLTDSITRGQEFIKDQIATAKIQIQADGGDPDNVDLVYAKVRDKWRMEMAKYGTSSVNQGGMVTISRAQRQQMADKFKDDPKTVIDNMARNRNISRRAAADYIQANYGMDLQYDDPAWFDQKADAAPDAAPGAGGAAGAGDALSAKDDGADAAQQNADTTDSGAGDDTPIDLVPPPPKRGGPGPLKRAAKAVGDWYDQKKADNQKIANSALRKVVAHIKKTGGTKGLLSIDIITALHSKKLSDADRASLTEYLRQGDF